MIFHNVGSKIKTVSEIFCYVRIILAVLLFGFFAIIISAIKSFRTLLLFTTASIMVCGTFL